MRRYEITPRLWLWIDPVLPHPTHQGRRGRPWKDHHTLINGILWVLHAGAPWRDLPERYGPWQTAYGRFNRWRKDGTWARIVTRLLRHLQRRGRIGRDLWCIDSTIIRAARAAAGAEKKSGPPAGAGGAEGGATQRAA